MNLMKNIDKKDLVHYWCTLLTCVYRVCATHTKSYLYVFGVSGSSRSLRWMRAEVEALSGAVTFVSSISQPACILQLRLVKWCSGISFVTMA